jgi:hypothetical protein
MADLSEKLLHEHGVSKYFSNLLCSTKVVKNKENVTYREREVNVLRILQILNYHVRMLSQLYSLYNVEWMTVNDEQRRIWKEAMVTCFNLYRHLSGDTMETN